LNTGTVDNTADRGVFTTIFLSNGGAYVIKGEDRGFHGSMAGFAAVHG